MIDQSKLKGYIVIEDKFPIWIGDSESSYYLYIPFEGYEFLTDYNLKVSNVSELCNFVDKKSKRELYIKLEIKNTLLKKTKYSSLLDLNLHLEKIEVSFGILGNIVNEIEIDNVEELKNAFIGLINFLNSSLENLQLYPCDSLNFFIFNRDYL